MIPNLSSFIQKNKGILVKTKEGDTVTICDEKKFSGVDDDDEKEKEEKKTKDIEKAGKKPAPPPPPKSFVPDEFAEFDTEICNLLGMCFRYRFNLRRMRRTGATALPSQSHEELWWGKCFLTYFCNHFERENIFSQTGPT